jgi:hypothetical protein
MSTSFKLVTAREAVVDYYTIKWINIVYEDPKSYEKFREAITEFLGDHKCKLNGDVLCVKAYMRVPRTGPSQHMFFVIQRSLIT